MNKKKILVLGANGLLGHRIYINLSKNQKLNVFGTIKKKLPKELINYKNIIYNFDATNLKNLKTRIKQIKPDFVINCIGVTNKKINLLKESEIIKINSFFPHYLDNLSYHFNYKLIHISTDCIFRGNKNFYTEEDICDVDDLYGVSKYAGELINKKSLTIRTSIIGHELNQKNGLVEWFLSKKKVSGYSKVIYSGVTTNELSRIIEKCIVTYNLNGLYHVSSKPISKYDLLKMINNSYNCNINIKKNTSEKKKLILKSNKFRKKTNYIVRSWKQQIDIMKKENNES